MKGKVLTGFSVFVVLCFSFLSAGISSEKKETKKSALGMTLQVDGMVCSECAKKVEQCLMKLKGVKSVDVSYEENQAEVEYDPKKVTVKKMIDALKKKGYKAKEKKESSE